MSFILSSETEKSAKNQMHNLIQKYFAKGKKEFKVIYIFQNKEKKGCLFLTEMNLQISIPKGQLLFQKDFVSNPGMDLFLSTIDDRKMRLEINSEQSIAFLTSNNFERYIILKLFELFKNYQNLNKIRNFSFGIHGKIISYDDEMMAIIKRFLKRKEANFFIDIQQFNQKIITKAQIKLTYEKLLINSKNFKTLSIDWKDSIDCYFLNPTIIVISFQDEKKFRIESTSNICQLFFRTFQAFKLQNKLLWEKLETKSNIKENNKNQIQIQIENGNENENENENGIQKYKKNNNNNKESIIFSVEEINQIQEEIEKISSFPVVNYQQNDKNIIKYEAKKISNNHESFEGVLLIFSQQSISIFSSKHCCIHPLDEHAKLFQIENKIRLEFEFLAHEFIFEEKQKAHFFASDFFKFKKYSLMTGKNQSIDYFHVKIVEENKISSSTSTIIIFPKKLQIVLPDQVVEYELNSQIRIQHTTLEMFILKFIPKENLSYLIWFQNKENMLKFSQRIFQERKKENQVYQVENENFESIYIFIQENNLVLEEEKNKEIIPIRLFWSLKYQKNTLKCKFELPNKEIIFSFQNLKEMKQFLKEWKRTKKI
ncbi:hypothetical protein M0811_13294 [Anaeramoeba ignava]|uniref:Uncharacterized protein n=1 Tax=Anaeramoeba ignava TaxID=1746090 RepID=A0A9Q0R598_ANAIG|nr:hypothetical protein M0811_13294 [Anaeramoeba ignava]